MVYWVACETDEPMVEITITNSWFETARYPLIVFVILFYHQYYLLIVLNVQLNQNNSVHYILSVLLCKGYIIFVNLKTCLTINVPWCTNI